MRLRRVRAGSVSRVLTARDEGVKPQPQTSQEEVRVPWGSRAQGAAVELAWSWQRVLAAEAHCAAPYEFPFLGVILVRQLCVTTSSF